MITTENSRANSNASSSACGGEAQTAKSDGPIPFSTIVGKTKMAAKTLDEVREKGVTFDLNIEQTPPEVEMDVLVDVDIEAEKLKAENCPYWEYEEFVGSFEFKDLENVYKQPLTDL